MTAGKSSSSTRGALRPDRVPNREVPFDVTIRGGNQDNSAETIVRRRDSLDLYFCGSLYEYPETPEFLHQPRSKDGHFVEPDDINAILGRRTGRATNALFRNLEAVQAQLDAWCSQ